MSAGRSVNSNNKHWGTPKHIVDKVKYFFNDIIELDPCSNEFSIVNAKNEFLLPETDGLKKDWNYSTIFVNPPYGSDRERKTTIKDWFKKAVETHKLYKSEIIMLVPVATNTSHWKEYVFPHANTICFVRDSRLKFLENGKEGGKGAPMACCLIYYGNAGFYFKKIFESIGNSLYVND